MRLGSVYRSRIFGMLLMTVPNTLPAGECRAIDTLDAFATSGLPPAGAECSTYLTATSGTGVSCHWENPYRAEAARRKASELWEMLIRCRDGKPLSPDKQVNHPDSYDLLTLAHGNTNNAINEKDKPAMKTKLVFLRPEPAGVAD